MSAGSTEQPGTAKRSRGRPKGSKTKNRMRTESILVPAPIRRPLHYNQIEAAAELGRSNVWLYWKAQEEGGIYEPAYKEGKSIIYTDTQIGIISLVMRGKVTNEQGLNLWHDIEDEELMSFIRRRKAPLSQSPGVPEEDRPPPKTKRSSPPGDAILKRRKA